jgi:hypothetical protein
VVAARQPAAEPQLVVRRLVVRRLVVRRLVVVSPAAARAAVVGAADKPRHLVRPTRTS